MGSTRLPGKVLNQVVGKPLLEHLLERLKKSNLIDEIVVATTVHHVDEPIVTLCKKLDVAFFRGSEHDVLSRYYEAALMFKVDVIVRITSDCPIIDPIVVDQIIQYYLQDENQPQYVSNVSVRTYPRGLDTEVFSFAALKIANEHAKTEAEREHVTSFIINHPDIFKIANFFYKKDVSQHRWTVDTPEDFQLIQLIFENLYPKNQQFTLEDTLELLEQFPRWQSINGHIDQKKT